MFITAVPQPLTFHTDYVYFKTDPHPPSNDAAIGVSVTLVILLLIGLAVGGVVLYIWLK